MLRSLVTLIVGALVAFNAAADHPLPKNQVSFDISASEEVDNDLLVVRMYAQQEARTQSQSADKVNQDMTWALTAAKAVSAVSVQTLDYRTNPVYDKREIRAWQTRQSLRLESANPAALTELLSTLQTRLAIESLGYEISPTKRAEVEERLIDLAVDRFSKRALRITASFHRSSYDIVNVNVGTGGFVQPPVAYRMKSMAMQAEVADPGIEAGQQALTVTINGTIEISDN